MNNINTILWDWNGTLFDDLEYCINIINQLLEKRSLAALSSERYKDIFTFPVKEYYQKAGFDFSKEDFSIPADEFMEAYNANVNKNGLHKHTLDILEHFRLKNFDQFIISAMKDDNLKESVKAKKINHYFKKVSGINHHYANGKMGNAKKIIHEFSLNPNECCFIGDTIHDHEVAEGIGCHCILIARGHQSKIRLQITGRTVLNTIEELLDNF